MAALAPAAAQVNAEPFHCKKVEAVVGAVTKLVVLAAVLKTILFAAPPATLVAVVADVADVAVEALPLKVAVMVPALKLPEASRATMVLAVFALVALDVTVNVELPDWLAVNVAEPESPVPETPRDKVPLLTFAAVVAVAALPFRSAVIVPALKLPDASRATMAFAVFALVAVVSEFGMDAEAVKALVPFPFTYPVREVAPEPPAATGKVPAVSVVAPVEYSALFAPVNVVRPVPPYPDWMVPPCQVPEDTVPRALTLPLPSRFTDFPDGYVTKTLTVPEKVTARLLLLEA